jgi:peptide deformylase
MPVHILSQYQDPGFLRVSRPILQFNERLFSLLDDLYDTLDDYQCVGIAAPHIGVLRRVAVVLTPSGKLELVNPVITQMSKTTQRGIEGSIAPDAPWAIVVRPTQVTVQAQDRNGKPFTFVGDDFLAATLCHEIDHLDGIWFFSKAEKVSFNPADLAL